MHVFLCNVINTSTTEKALMTRLGNGLEREKIVNFSLWENVEYCMVNGKLNKGPKYEEVL